MVDFGKSDKMIKISGKGIKPTLTTDSAIYCQCWFIHFSTYFYHIYLYIFIFVFIQRHLKCNSYCYRKSTL